MTPPNDLELLERLCRDPLVTADEARGRVGPVWCGDADPDEPRYPTVTLPVPDCARHAPAGTGGHT